MLKTKNWFMAGKGVLAVFIAFFLLRKRQKAVNLPVVQNFNKEKYLGLWYEIARLDYLYERNLKNTTAEYSVNDNGTIRIVNKGYNIKTGKEETAVGSARFAGPETEGRLKVSFFKPIYAAYNIVAIDDAYQNALVAGKNLDYLWLLSREKKMPRETEEKFLKIAQSAGFDTTRLIWVEHD